MSRAAPVLVRGELDIASRTALTEAVVLLVSDGCRRVVLDLHAMGFCDICGLGVEASAQVVSDANGELVLRHAPPQLLDLLALVELRTSMALLPPTPGGQGHEDQEGRARERMVEASSA